MTSTKDPFAAYRLPPAVGEGVRIALPNTPAEFIVRLPSGFNETFQAAFLSRLNESVSVATNEDGGEIEMNVDPSVITLKQREAFRDTCIVRAEGLPPGMDEAAFFDAYPIALRVLFDEAQEQARALDEEMETALGNSARSRGGRRGGRAVKINSASPNKPGSSPRAASGQS
jgi:hypothetical protein